jgi:hypothetical protein
MTKTKRRATQYFVDGWRGGVLWGLDDIKSLYTFFVHCSFTGLQVFIEFHRVSSFSKSMSATTMLFRLVAAWPNILVAQASDWGPATELLNTVLNFGFS